MFKATKMKRVDQLLLATTIRVKTKNGRSSILIKLKRLKHLDLTKNLVSISTDHFILYLNFQ